MKAVVGKVGAREITWLSAPRGAAGTARVRVGGGEIVEIRWRRDLDGLWLELPHGTYGFDFDGETGEDGRILYNVTRRGGGGEWSGLSFLRAGEEHAAQAQSGKKKGLRIRAQMPGKILRVLAKQGQAVAQGQPLLVMEAMKMENEIKAPVDGTVREILVSEGGRVSEGDTLAVVE